MRHSNWSHNVKSLSWNYCYKSDNHQVRFPISILSQLHSVLFLIVPLCINGSTHEIISVLNVVGIK